MIQFVTVFVDAAGSVQGCTCGDMPTPDEHALDGLTKVSVGAITACGEHLKMLSRKIMTHIDVVAVDGGWRASFKESARQFGTTMFTCPSTETDVKAAASLNPVVAHWLMRKLPFEHDWGEHITTCAAASPRHAETCDQLLKRRYVKETQGGFQALERAAERVQATAAANAAWQDMLDAINATPPAEPPQEP